ncbi:hypothetical protein GJAV_G00209230 [Gymnothorax javanicus]|nr:hypothetical protein GJAV_G00209230 [Gymnothorax javanicus]
MECEPSEKDGGETAGRGRARKRATQEEAEESSDEETAEAAKRPDQPKRPLRKGSSMDSEKGEGVRRRGELRRGSSADSALLLHIKPEEGTDEGAAEDGKKVLKKAVSMELPRRSPSPGTGKMSQEDYALKLELMRQRLLRGGAVDNKMSGLRGPLLETLGMADEKRYSSLDRYTRPSRLGVAPLIRAASSESPRDDTHKTKVLRKSASFSQGDAEPIPLHRRSGAPLEIPLAQIEERRLQEAPSMSALTEQPRLDSLPATPKELSKPPTPELDEQEQVISSRMKQDASEESRRKLMVDQGDGASERRMRMLEEEREEKAIKECEYVSERMSQSGMAPRTVEEETELKVKDEREKEYYAIGMKEEQEKHQGTSPEITVTTSSITFPPVATKMAPTYISSSPPARVTLPDGRTSAYASIIQTIMVPSLQPADTSALATATPTIASTPTPTPTSVEPEPPSWTEHPAVFSRVASTEQPAKEPSPTKTSPHPTLPRETSAGQDIEDITSEEIFESRFKKRESSLTRGLKLLTKSKGEEKQSVEAASAGEEIYRPGPIGAPLEFSRRLEKSKSVQDLREASKDSSFMKRFSMRLKRSPSAERKEEIGTPDSGTLRRRLSWNLGRNRTQEKKEVEMVRLDGVAEPQLEEEARETKKSTESPVLVMRKKIESTVAGISMRIRSHSMDRREEKEDKEAKPESKRTPLLSILRRTSSEGVNLKKIGQSSATASTESLESTSSIQSETSTKTTESERRSRWDRWGLTRGRKDKTVSQPDIPSAIARENGSLRGRQYSRLASDFPPVFHIKLRDHVLLEGDPVTLSCLPAGSPHPRITWMKDKKKLHIDARMNAISCPDGRQLLMIMKTTKNDAGLYECVASNPLATVTSSCLISLARLPNRPGTPEIPQKYKNTALVLWRPSDTLAPCTYSLERRTEGETNWLIVATGVAECYYNATDLPEGGTFRFRVACVNKAGQGPYSNLSEKVCLDTTGAPKPSGVVIVKTIPSPKPSAETSSEADLTIEPTVPSEALEPSAPPVTTSTDATPPQEPGLPAPTSTRTTPTPESGPPVPTPSRISPPRGTGKDHIKHHSHHHLLPCSTHRIPSTSCPAQITEPGQHSSSHISNHPSLPAPLSVPAPAIGKPISSVPLYVPATTAPALPAGPALSPPVVLVTSLSPVGDGTATPSHMTPTGRATPSGRITPTGRRTPSGKPGESSLRQGVPQKPYTFMDEKARGRFGVIRECRENATGKLFMAKIVPYEPDSKQTVLQEYDILKSLHHSRIMALHEAYVTPRYLVLISECCSGKEVLYSLIDRFRYSEDDVVTYLVQILQGLDYLHNRRILHLDIKPDNIIITPMNSVKIIDFGSAQTFNPLFLKQFGRRVGTLEFMSPEMVKGDVVGPPADMWSVGVLTFIMLSGRLPFMEKDPKDTEAKIQVARFDLTKLYPNVSQSASLFLKKILCSYPWARPTIKDCFSNSWLQDAYLMKLRRQTLTFTTTRLKEFLVEHQRRRTETATKHKVLLRSYQSTAQSPTTPTMPTSPTTPVPTTPTPVSSTPAPTTPGTK